MDLSGKKVLVIGFGVSGIAAAELLEKHGAKVVLFDQKPSEKALANVQAMEHFTGETAVGSLTEAQEEGIEMLVISPGVPIDSPMVNHFRDKGVLISGDIELAYQCAKGKLAAITGTNGKTTTTALTGQILREEYPSTFVVGNIGDPYTREADKMTEESATAAEISSFQLETIHEFHPQVSAILNITPDHLNRHHTMQCYIETKESIVRNQTAEDVCVLNYEDEELRRFGQDITPRVVWFSSRRKLEEGLYLQGEEIYLAQGGESRFLLNIHELKLLGEHNYENVMAAIAIGLGMGVPEEKVLHACREFVAVEHRIEYVDEINGVKYYNDSKGTNVDAAIKGIQAMITPTCLIGGGYDKGSTYDEWIESFDGKVKKLVLIGQTADAIEACARAHGFTAIEKTDSLEHAVAICAAAAEPGESVLLSPACASWGMFENYEQRGRLFKEYVRAMKK